MQRLAVFLTLLTAHALPTPAEVAAGVSRASTPLRARPVSEAVAQAALAPFGGNLTSMWAQATAADAGKGTPGCRAHLLQYEHALRLYVSPHAPKPAPRTHPLTHHHSGAPTRQDAGACAAAGRV